MKTIINTLKAIILIACIILLSSGESLLSQNTEFSRYGAVGFGIGAKGYMGTGLVYLNGSYAYRKDFWEYDPITDSWSQKADFGGTARYGAVGFCIGSLGYIGTGLGFGGNNDLWEYNPSKNTWTKKADFRGSARLYAVGFCIGSKGYVGTGQLVTNTGIVCLKDFWEYTPGSGNNKGTWKRIADLPGASRHAAVGFGIGQKGYLTTGINFDEIQHYTFLRDLWEYDPNTSPKTGGKWTQKTDFPGAARAYGTGFSINNTKGYIGTGNTPGAGNTGMKKDFWEYDPANTETGPWTQKADFSGVARDLDVGFNIGNKGYIGTGLINRDVLIQDFWQFDPGSTTGPGTWLQKADFGMHRAVLKDGDAIENPFPASNEELTVYPNPSGSTFNFRLNSASHEPVNIRVFDIMGRMVHEYSSLSPDEIISVGDNLNAGVYIAVVTQGEFRKSVKINKVN